MKKSGIINRGILKGLGETGHTDIIFICDAGFPIPPGSPCVDLSIVKGTPQLETVAEALIGEMVVEEYFIHDLMAEVNPEGHDYVVNRFIRQKANEVAFEVLKEKAVHAKLIIRTGDVRPCSNLALVAASGVQEMVDQYILQ